MNDYRCILLSHLLNPNIPLPANFEVCPSRLAKFPPGRPLLADRGFANDAYLYPNFNHHFTPHFLSGREQFEASEIGQDRKVCEFRYTGEVVYSRFTDLKSLRDVVPYGMNHILPDIIHWGHAYNNLQQPLKKPRDWETYLHNLEISNTVN